MHNSKQQPLVKQLVARVPLLRKEPLLENQVPLEAKDLQLEEPVMSSLKRKRSKRHLLILAKRLNTNFNRPTQ